MKNKINVDGIELVGEQLLTKITPIPNRSKAGIVENATEAFRGDKVINYMGKVIKTGPKVKDVDIGEFVMFSMMSGQKVLTVDKGDYKVVGESESLIYSKMSGMKAENVIPLDGRMLLDIKEKKIVEKTKSGVITSSGGEEDDPTERDLVRGVVIVLPGDLKDSGFKVGDVVYFEAGMGIEVDELKGDGEYVLLKPLYIKMKYKE